MHRGRIATALSSALALVLAWSLVACEGDSAALESPEATREALDSTPDDEARREQLRSLGYINP